MVQYMLEKGHRTQACWWNSDQQHQQQHLQHRAWFNPSKQQHKTAEASKMRSQHQDNKTSKPVTFHGLTLANHLASSLEQVSASLEHQAPVTIAMLEKSSSLAEAWGILVDTGAATSVAHRALLLTLNLAQHLPPSSLQLQQEKKCSSTA